MVLKDNDMSLKVKLCQEWITTQEHLPQKFGKIRRSIFANFKPVFFFLNWLFLFQVYLVYPNFVLRNFLKIFDIGIYKLEDKKKK